MNKIQQIKSEVDALQAELDKLRKRNTGLSQSFSPPISGSTAAELLETIEAATTAASERRQEQKTIQEAIAYLTPQLSQKQAELAELQKQQWRDDLERERIELQPQLLELAHEINGLSIQHKL